MLHWRPVGRLPARVYWQRRIMLAAVLTVILIVVAYSCSGGTAPRRTANGHRTSPAPSASASPTVGTACGAGDLKVQVITDASVYPAGSEPHFTLSVTTTRACRLNFGASARRFTVLSGADRIWRSADCQPRTAPRPVLLRPGHPRQAAVIWARVRSAPGCPTGEATAQAGTYRVIAAIAGVASPEAVFSLR